MIPERASLLAGLALSLGLAWPLVRAADAMSSPAYFEKSIRPLLTEYCFSCHSTEKPKGELDLERFVSIDQVRKHPKVWQAVLDQLALGEMPPREKPQPAAEQREQLLSWVHAVLNEMALARAGDPGPVMLRRLSNAEYTYTIRDLTGVESLDPAREFPVDGAAGEGFMNVGHALVMSPSLVIKYLDAAKEIASHAMLVPDGIRFSAKNSRRDWTEEILAEIRGLYSRYTEEGGGTDVDLQGIRFDTNDGGVLPLANYFSALWHERATGKSAAAANPGLSAKYLDMLREALHDTKPSRLLDPIRARWRMAGLDEVAALVADVAEWQRALWKFNSVGHVGKKDGPKEWLEPLNPLAFEQEVRLKIPESDEGKEVVLYLTAGDAGDGNENDFVIWQQPRFIALGRPPLLLRDTRADSEWGIDPARFGKRTDGSPGQAADLYVQAPSVIAFRLPAELVAGCEFVTTGSLDPQRGTDGSVQLQVLTHKPSLEQGLRPAGVTKGEASGPWSSSNRRISHHAPILVTEGSAVRKRIEAELELFRQLFPAALCYRKIVPVDEVVTLTLFHREDHHLARLMLDESEVIRLDRLWAELRYVSQDALKLVDVFEQLWQYATQDADPSVFEPLREPIQRKAAEFNQWIEATEPKHLEAVVEFAARAYRRPLDSAAKDELRVLHQKLRREGLAHDEAIRLTLARVLVSPEFLYRAEKPGPAQEPVPVDDWELASRLSYFLWSSMPDAELRQLAAAGTLRDPDVLEFQARRLLADPRVRRLATEFGCVWLHIYDFDELDEKSSRHFPTFTALRGSMYEETIRFFTDLFQNDRSVGDLLNADHTFVNEPLAKHYGIAISGFDGPNDWRRVEGVRRLSRGGILAQATVLAKQSGASRTSPILRGNWVSEVLLGEKLPRPPKDVPPLPEDEATEALTVRQLTERHSSDPRCAGCHSRIDAFGYALEKFDAIGRHRDRDLGDRPIDTRATLFDGSELDGLEGLRDYLLTQRGDAFLQQFCRKLLGYSLGRAVQLSDRPLIEEMQKELQTNGYRVSAAVETIVLSKQFRHIRGMEMADEE